MKVAVFSSKGYDQKSLNNALSDSQSDITFDFLDCHLSEQTANLASGYDAICCFVNDQLDAPVLKQLNTLGVNKIALRCAGFNRVDLDVAKALGFKVARVPEYSPHAVAEHALALILTLNRQIHRAHNRVRENNFALNGLLGFDLHGKTVGVIGTGKIGETFANIMLGLGCKVIATDPYVNTALEQQGVNFVELDTLLNQSDIISLHCPLSEATHYLIDEKALSKTKNKVMLINTSRGALIDTKAVIQALKRGHIGYLGLDVYEEEADLFFDNQSEQMLQDDIFARLLTFPNVLITGHQGFFTEDALNNIAHTTIDNLINLENNQLPEKHRVC